MELDTIHEDNSENPTVSHRIATDKAKQVLDNVFAQATEGDADVALTEVPAAISSATTRLFASKTQAYREALVGCCVARLINPLIDIRLPATDLGEDSFSGRTLADKVVGPFLNEKAIPISKSPYLSALRGGAKLIPGGQPRIQGDQAGFDALVEVVEFVRNANPETATAYLRHLLRCFIGLREQANISLKKLAKPNLEQLSRLVKGLLKLRSGGRFPAMLATSLFQTISECHNLGWAVEFQGINVADKASGAVGDISIKKDGTILLGIEVTERPISQARVTVTFDQKISPNGVTDYLFISTATPTAEAVSAARSYTGVGHEMNFVSLEEWLIHNLATVGSACRTVFQAKMVTLLEDRETPAELRVAWNDTMNIAIGLAT